MDPKLTATGAVDQLDEEGNEDQRRAAALATETDLGGRYILQFRTFGSICSISAAACSAYWGFSPPAAVLTFIAQDIGMLIIYTIIRLIPLGGLKLRF